MQAEMEITQHPSPNFNRRQGGRPPDLLVIHYTGMETMAGALDRLTDRQARVSAHYLISEEGQLFQLVGEEKRAWHAGVSSWRGERDINSRSIGIELVNPGQEFGYRPFPERQLARLEALAVDLVARYDIKPQNIVGHSDVAPERKSDPGELFDWARLADQGIGLWAGEVHQGPPDEGRERTADIDWRDLQGKLSALGYGMEPSGQGDAATGAVVTAFQRHWRQGQVSGRPDPHTLRVLDALLALIG